MDKKQEEILSGTYEIFKKYGLRSVSMDDIARELRVSKKTIYLYYKNKTELIADVLDIVLDQQNYMGQIDTAKGNAIDHLLFVGQKVMENIGSLNPLFLFDLEKYYPELCTAFFARKTEMIYSHILDNINKGVEQNLYRDRVNADLVATLYTERIKEVRSLADSSNLQKFSFAQIITQLVEGHIRAIVNEEGLKYFEERTANNYNT